MDLDKLDKISSDENSDSEQVPSPSVLPDKCSETTKESTELKTADFDAVQDEFTSDDEFDCSTDLKLIDSEFWAQSIAPTKYYQRSRTGGQTGTKALLQLQNEFNDNVLKPIRTIRESQPCSDPPKEPKFHACASCDNNYESSSSCDSESISDEEAEGKKGKRNKSNGHGHNGRNKKNSTFTEIQRKRNHPSALHPDISFNEPGQVNDGPYCKCSWAAKQSGVRHNKFSGERMFEACDPNSSNIHALHHYVLKVDPSPSKSSLSRYPTTITVDGISYTFDGFSAFFHQSLPVLFPQTPINQWSSEFNIRFVRENSPETISELYNSGSRALPLVLVRKCHGVIRLGPKVALSGTERRVVSLLSLHASFRSLSLRKTLFLDGGKEILPMSSVLNYFKNSFAPFVNDDLAMGFCSDDAALRAHAHNKKGQIFMNPAKKPMAIRADLIDAYDQIGDQADFYPLLTHFGVRPSAYAYSGKPEYQRALKHFIKLRHLLSLKARLSEDDRQKLGDDEDKLKKLKAEW